MTDSSDDDVWMSGQVRTMLRVMQIIVGALTVGLLNFLLIILLVIKPHPKPTPPLPLVSTVAVAWTAVIVSLSFLVHSLLLKNARRKISKGTWTPPNPNMPPLASGPEGDAVKLLLSYQAAMIIVSAMTEGCGFFALIAYMLEGQPWMLLLAGFCILLVAARFPIRGRIDQWLAEQQERIAEERQGGW